MGGLQVAGMDTGVGEWGGARGAEAHSSKLVNDIHMYIPSVYVYNRVLMIL